MARKPAARKPAASKAPSKPGSIIARTPLLEWIAGGIGLALVLLAVGLIGREALLGDPSPPAVIVEARGIQPVPGGWLVSIEVINRGGAAAAQVIAEGELTLPGAEPQTAEATFDYVPDHSRRKGGLFFRDDPRTGALTLRAKGYVEP